jgi:hypothetical protein
MMMRPYRESDGIPLNSTSYRLFCRPSDVAQTAERLRASGLVVTCEGTSHVDVSTMLNAAELLSIIGTTWQRRDLQVMP